MSTPGEDANNGNVQLSKRERGKLAQREYRKRHASKFQSLKDENLRLKNAIRKINKAASRHDTRPEFLDALNEAAALVATDDAEKKREAPSNRPNGNFSLSRPSSGSTSRDVIRSGSSSPGDSPDSRDARDRHYTLSLGLPVWDDTDRLVRIYEAPADVMPYLGEGLFTFAGCLYWACTYYAVSLWRKSKKLPQPDLSYQSRLDRMFNHSKHLNDHEFLLSVAQARVEFRKKGFVDRVYESDYVAENEALARVHNQVKREYEDRNEALQWWRKPKEVEDYIRPHLSEEESTQLQEIVEGRGSMEAFEMFAPLFETLAQSFVCFGDGPRWNLIHISVTVGAWLSGRRKS